MRGKGVTESMTGCAFYDASLLHSIFTRFLYDGLINVMAAFLPCSRIYPAILLRKYPLPAPLGWRAWIFAIKSISGSAISAGCRTLRKKMYRFTQWQ
jgi:hypothetical protein